MDKDFLKYLFADEGQEDTSSEVDSSDGEDDPDEEDEEDEDGGDVVDDTESVS